MSLSDLYQEIILDHGKSPRNYGVLPNATHTAEGYNPLCGDQVRVAIKIVDSRIEAIQFEGCGCAISTASASIMTSAVQGRTIEEAIRLFDEFHRLVVDAEPGDDSADLGELAALVGVRQFPSRVKCATLCWHAMKTAIESHKSDDLR